MVQDYTDDPQLVEVQPEVIHAGDDDAAVLGAPPAANLRVNTLALEVWGSTPNLRVQALGLEAWATPSVVTMRVSEAVLEAWAINTGSLRVAALALEAWVPAPVAALTLGFGPFSAPRLNLASSRIDRSASFSAGTPLLDLVMLNQPVFPSLLGLAYPVTKELVYGALTQEVASGQNMRLREWADPVWHYTVKFDFLRQGAAYLELQALMGLFMQSLGQEMTFFYSDPDDNATSHVVIGDAINNTTQRTFQLLRGFYDNSGNLIATAPVYVPVPGTVTVNLNTATDGTGGTPTSAFVTAPWGKVIFNAPPGAPGSPGSHYYISASCTFYQLCRFEADQNDFDGLWNQFFELKQLKFKTVKPTAGQMN